MGFALCLCVAASAQDGATLLSDHDWRATDTPLLGGLSGLEVDADGTELLALSDRATLINAVLTRDAAGAIAGVTITGVAPLTGADGTRPPQNGAMDSEGLARGADGTIWIAYEGDHRVASHAQDGREIRRLPPPPDAANLPANRSFEALAIDAQGQLYTISEGTVQGDVTPLFRFADGQWQTLALIARSDGFQPVGLDIDDRGRLYLLERRFSVLGGFATRLTRHALTDRGLGPGRVLLETAPGTHGNLEGVALWRDGAGRLIATLVSDDNFMAFLHMELVEYILPD